MSAAVLLTVAGLATVGTYLVTSRSLSRMVLGFSVLGHGAVLALLLAGGPAGRPPLSDEGDVGELANPLPQALALTAIVISFGLTLFLLALARRQATITGDDLVEDDVEDRRISRLAEAEDTAAERGPAPGAQEGAEGSGPSPPAEGPRS